MAIKNRFLELVDRDALNHVALDVFDNPIHPDGVRAFLSDPNHFIVVAQDIEKDDLIVGFVSASRQFHPDWERPELFISEVGVAPPYHRRGIGKALMQMMLDTAKEMNCTCAWVATDADNAAALGLYKSVGGTPPETHVHIDLEL